MRMREYRHRTMQTQGTSSALDCENAQSERAQESHLPVRILLLGYCLLRTCRRTAHSHRMAARVLERPGLKTCGPAALEGRKKLPARPSRQPLTSVTLLRVCLVTISRILCPIPLSVLEYLCCEWYVACVKMRPRTRPGNTAASVSSRRGPERRSTSQRIL